MYFLIEYLNTKNLKKLVKKIENNHKLEIFYKIKINNVLIYFYQNGPNIVEFLWNKNFVGRLFNLKLKFEIYDKNFNNKNCSKFHLFFLNVLK